MSKNRSTQFCNEKSTEKRNLSLIFSRAFKAPGSLASLILVGSLFWSLSGATQTKPLNVDFKVAKEICDKTKSSILQVLSNAIPMTGDAAKAKLSSCDTAKDPVSMSLEIRKPEELNLGEINKLRRAIKATVCDGVHPGQPNLLQTSIGGPRGTLASANLSPNLALDLANDDVGEQVPGVNLLATGASNASDGKACQKSVAVLQKALGALLRDQCEGNPIKKAAADWTPAGDPAYMSCIQTCCGSQGAGCQSTTPRGHSKYMMCSSKCEQLRWTRPL